MVHRFSCSVACGIFLGQGSNLCLLHWQEDSLRLSHQRSPALFLLVYSIICLLFICLFPPPQPSAHLTVAHTIVWSSYFSSPAAVYYHPPHLVGEVRPLLWTSAHAWLSFQMHSFWIFLIFVYALGCVESYLQQILSCSMWEFFFFEDNCFIMLVSAVQQRESAISIQNPSLVSLPPSALGHHRALSWAPCAVYQLPTRNLSYTW